MEHIQQGIERKWFIHLFEEHGKFEFSLLRMGILFQSSNMNVFKLESKGPMN